MAAEHGSAKAADVTPAIASAVKPPAATRWCLPGEPLQLTAKQQLLIHAACCTEKVQQQSIAAR
jgi:hypothetical protein